MFPAPVLTAALLLPLAPAAPQEADAVAPADPQQAWMAAAEPGDAHKILDAMAGTWETAGKFYMGPDAPPVVGTGTQTNTWTLGGRWLDGKYEGTFMGMPMEGRSRFGHDNLKGEYVSTWTDTFSTGLMVDRGTYDEKAKTITLLGEAADPVSGRTIYTKSVITLAGPDEFTIVTRGTAPGAAKDSLMFKTMELTYTRKK